MQIVSWNVQWCCGLDGQVQPQRILDTVQAMGGCDVLCLQEIARNYPQLTGHPTDVLAQLRALWPHWHWCFGAAVQEGVGEQARSFGNVIATRLPVLQVLHYPLPYPADEGVASMPRMCTVAIVQDPKLGPVRVMTTHLAYHSARQRMAQAHFLRRLHFEALSQTVWAPRAMDDGSPYGAKAHPVHAVLCGDFNFNAQANEYEALASQAAVIECLDAGWPEQVVGARWHDAWRVLHPDTPQPATFGVHDSHWSAAPTACDLMWLSNSLRAHAHSMHIDGESQASDHQPVRLVLQA